MARAPRARFGWLGLAAALAVLPAAAALPLNTPAWVKNALSLGRTDDLHGVPSVARFVMDEGGGFVLDRSHRPAMLKFDDAAEVWALSTSRGPGGDVLFKDDAGDTLLRATKFGGLTAFTARRPGGSAAALVGAVSPLRLAPIGPGALYQHMVQASIRCSRATHRLVGFEAPDADAKSAAVIADAAQVAADTLSALYARPGARRSLARIGKVVIAKSGKPGAYVSRGALVIFVNPGAGLSGHPSSAKIAQAVVGS